MNFLNILVLFGGYLVSYDCYKILALFPMPSGSHYNLNSRIVNELAARGHEVTHVTPFPQKNAPINLKEIPCRSDTLDAQQKSLFRLDQEGVYEKTRFMIDAGYGVTENLLKSEETQKILKNKEKYDVVLAPGQYVNEGSSAIAHHLQAPLILLSTMPLFPWTSFQLGHPSTPSYVPHLVGLYSGHMNFCQRLVNSFHYLYTIMYHQWVILPKYRDMVKKYIPGEPDLYDFLNNASLVLLNSHISIYDARPQIPNVIEIGGFHIKESKKLPEDLQKFLDNSVEGVVVFSMGSNLKTSELPLATLNGIFRAFSKLKQKVMCKWETEQPPEWQPPNVKLLKWLPQLDILAHPNVKALICHGGLLSLEETIYYGIPVIGIPVFGDQKMNMATVMAKGFAVQLHLQDLGEETLSKALNQILFDSKYRTNAQKYSKIMRDRALKPLDSALYWIEYVVRHQGAPHLRYPGVELAWYQRDLLDVAAFTLVAIVLFISMIFLVIKRILRRFRPSQDKNKKND